MQTLTNYKLGIQNRNEEGFTLIELMIVIVIIGILAAIAIPIFATQQKAAIDASSKESIRQLKTAIEIARVKQSKTLVQITGTGCTVCGFSAAGGTDPLNLPKTNGGWVAYERSLARISEASGMDVTGLLDGYGRPIFIDENEGESAGGCGKDLLATHKNPYTYADRENIVALSLYTTACN